MPTAWPLKSKRGAFSVMLAQYRLPRHHVAMPCLSCSLVIPSSSRCCSASWRMPCFSGTLGAGLTGKANGKCFCNSQIASTAGSCSYSFVCGEGVRVRCFVLSVFICTFSARKRSRNSANCSKPIVQFAATSLECGARLSHAVFWHSLIKSLHG